MALTLAQFAVQVDDTVRQGVIEEYYGQSVVLQHLPFENVVGGAYEYDREGALPSVAFRGLNEGYTESTGILVPIVEICRPFGGTCDVDRVMIKRGGNAVDLMARQVAMKSKAASLLFTKKFFHGDSETNPKEFDGLRKRLTGNSVIELATNGLDAVSSTANSKTFLNKMREALDYVVGENKVLYCSKAFRRKIEAVADNLGKNVLGWMDGPVGERIMTFDTVPIQLVELDEGKAEIFQFNEDCGSSSVTQSAYIVAHGETDVMGIQTDAIEVVDVPLQVSSTAVAQRKLIEWDAGIVTHHGRAAVRIKGLLA